VVGVATTAEVRDLLAGTSLPRPVVDSLLEGASPLWLLGQAPEQVAGDLALCHPALRPGEVRAIAHPLEGGTGHKVSVVAPDRPGLMAGTAGALAAHGLTIVAAAASSWPDLGVSVQRVVVEPAVAGADVGWDAVGADLTAALTGTTRLSVRFTPCPPVSVSTTDEGAGRAVVSVRAPDRVGLLWAIASWFEEHGCNIEVANIDADGGTATDTFVVSGRIDADALATHLAGRSTPAPLRPVTAGLSAGLALGKGAARLATAPVRAVLRR
jgi:UTP:GlnB (protein PII) uridylyltransferase